MELVADYDLEIAYHPGKANLVANALSRRRASVSSEQNLGSIVNMLRTLQLNAITEGVEPLGLEAADRADLLTRIRIAQEQDENLNKVSQNDKTEYQTSNNGTIVVNGRVCVPDVKELKDEILKEAHQSRFSVHPGMTKMYQDLKRYYHWVGMKRDVAKWVAGCETCQLVKAEHQFPSGLLQTLPMPEWKWDMITMDFVLGLPKTKKLHDGVWVIVDRLTKSAHFLAMKKTDGVPKLVDMYIDQIVRLHGVPVSIISDRDPKFTSRFWKEFQEACATRLHMSTAYHPQTDGQSERTIRTLEDMLRACVLDWGGSWEDYLPLAEFAYNNSYQRSIEMSPYEALYGRPCRTPLCWTQVGERSVMGPAVVEATTEKIRLLKVKLKEAMDRQKSYADKRRRDLEFSVGDMVYLKALTYKGTDRAAKSAKLNPRYMGPYRILERVGAVAYKLDLPSEMGAFHNVFHVSQLRKHMTERETVIEEPPADLQEDLAVVARPVRVIDRKEETKRGKLVRMVQVVWDCDGQEQVTWENEARMKAEHPKWFDKLQTDELDSRTNPERVGESCSISIRENSE